MMKFIHKGSRAQPLKNEEPKHEPESTTHHCYRKRGTHERVLTQPLAHGNSKNRRKNSMGTVKDNKKIAYRHITRQHTTSHTYSSEIYILRYTIAKCITSHTDVLDNIHHKVYQNLQRIHIARKVKYRNINWSNVKFIQKELAYTQ